MNKNDSVYPHEDIKVDEVGIMYIPADAGLTVRDWLAAQALGGVYSLALENVIKTGKPDMVYKENIAAMCYEMADAMIAESNK